MTTTILLVYIFSLYLYNTFCGSSVIVRSFFPTSHTQKPTTSFHTLIYYSLIIIHILEYHCTVQAGGGRAAAGRGIGLWRDGPARRWRRHPCFQGYLRLLRLLSCDSLCTTELNFGSIFDSISDTISSRQCAHPKTECCRHSSNTFTDRRWYFSRFFLIVVPHVFLKVILVAAAAAAAIVGSSQADKTYSRLLASVVIF